MLQVTLVIARKTWNIYFILCSSSTRREEKMRLMQLGVIEDTTLRTRLGESLKIIRRRDGGGAGIGSGRQNSGSSGGIDIWRAEGEDDYPRGKSFLLKKP